MRPEYLVVAGGVFHLLFAVFHVLFWKLFRWRSDLAKLTSLNRAVMQILNICLTLVFVLFAYISFAHTADMVGTPLGRSLLLLISIFWYLRAAQQIVFFGLQKSVSLLLFVLFLAAGTLYALALL